MVIGWLHQCGIYANESVFIDENSPILVRGTILQEVINARGFANSSGPQIIFTGMSSCGV